MLTSVLVGLLVGGKATRLGGIAKGMLPAPDTGEPLAGRLARVCREAVPGAHVLLVGNAAAYASLGLPSLDDARPGVGPLGGIAALLDDALRRHSVALALAADLPYVTTDLVARILAHAPHADAVAPRPAGRWQPLFARYSPAACLPIVNTLLGEQRFAARGVLESSGDRAVALPLTPAEESLLDDWDTPEDVRRAR